MGNVRKQAVAVKAEKCTKAPPLNIAQSPKKGGELKESVLTTW